MKIEMIVPVMITRTELENVAEYFTDCLSHYYSNTVMEVAGLAHEELIEALVDNPTMQSIVSAAVRLNGQAALEEPSEHIEYESIFDIPEFKPIEQWLDEVYGLVEDVENSYQEPQILGRKLSDLKKALIAAGFRVMPVDN